MSAVSTVSTVISSSAPSLRPGAVLWLNRNYATTVHFIEQLRRGPGGRDLTVIGSHRDLSSPMLAACDRVFAEPELAGDDYADFAVRFCRDEGVDVFLPVHEQLAVTRAAARFAAVGTALIAPPAAAVSLLADKAATNRTMAARPGLAALVPPFREVATTDEFEAAVRALSEPAGERLIVKPVDGVGASGVRLLSDTPPTLADLTGPAGITVTVQDFVQALKHAEATGAAIPRLMVMPYLDEPEVSVDVLADAGRTVVAVPRTKAARRRSLDAPAGVLDAAAELVDAFDLDGLVNVQFRMRHGRPVLLEINTRPAGGVFQTGLAGVNLPWTAVARALGDRTPPPVPVLGAAYVTVSGLVPLSA